MNWESQRRFRSERHTDVEFVVARMTFGRRVELMKLIRDLAVRLEYFEAGRDGKSEMEASLLAAQIDRLYLQWGLLEIHGLRIDGELACTDRFVESGPEDLVREALQLVRRECGLVEEERKN